MQGKYFKHRSTIPYNCSFMHIKVLNNVKPVRNHIADETCWTHFWLRADINLPPVNPICKHSSALRCPEVGVWDARLSNTLGLYVNRFIQRVDFGNTASPSWDSGFIHALANVGRIGLIRAAVVSLPCLPAVVAMAKEPIDCSHA